MILLTPEVSRTKEGLEQISGESKNETQNRDHNVYGGFDEELLGRSGTVGSGPLW